MAAIRNETVLAAIIRASALTDPNIHNDITKLYEFRKQTLLDDESLTADERTEAIKKLTINYDHNKLLFNEGTKRRCENCSLECLATSYCEHCVRNYLKNNFSNWTSGNSDIDDLIKECQIKSFRPDKLIEWIP
ncbi:hypothetical protein GLOIN_2v1763109 [Rhizophagus irregularis DAOM 181602=DAOM 197198]|uniref:Uncharacterized protein n=2 Tax=Rhizophagus irregularis TaxID=588596 RepID=A0A015JX18_RHIIW|nr:hypothetical protein GLOIN_2v1763109 [Rhizophagus irregularis DAOM 181602=DAOM 197198]EXX51666.1 hypothetical protein RirG_259780 [Rhizophagus irregularis DAOM 197198w]POG81534.1 hypothetical protein GLOIN_2v1763109 [Rhizophagus irregularis DAOM 181602=DAOM 197198]|eukprot:XP_025188400.1 hypothetical protein GLOIN_2v1763109 [Rhizophagus irregularis DAOM 181602=DAOM 197198]